MNDANLNSSELEKVDELKWAEDFLEELAKFGYDAELKIGEIRWAFVRAHKTGLKPHRDITAEQAARLFAHQEFGRPDPTIDDDLGMLTFAFRAIGVDMDERDQHLRGPDIFEILNKREKDSEESEKPKWIYIRPNYESGKNQRKPRPKVITGVEEYHKQLAELGRILTERKTSEERKLMSDSEFAKKLSKRKNIRFTGERKGRRYSHANSLRKLSLDHLADAAVKILEKNGKPMQWGEIVSELTITATIFHRQKRKTDSESVMEPSDYSLYYSSYYQILGEPYIINLKPREEKFYAGNDVFSDEHIQQWCKNAYSSDWFRNSSVTIQRLMSSGGQVVRGSKKGEWVHRNAVQDSDVRPIEILSELERKINVFTETNKSNQAALDLLEAHLRMILREVEITKKSSELVNSEESKEKKVRN
jgi:hypothetical protein